MDEHQVAIWCAEDAFRYATREAGISDYISKPYIMYVKEAAEGVRSHRNVLGYWVRYIAKTIEEAAESDDGTEFL